MVKDHRKTWKYKYYELRSIISIWCEAKIEIYYRSRKDQWLAKFIFNHHKFNSSYWFCKEIDLINDIYGRQRGQFFYKDNQTKEEIDEALLEGGGWY